MTMMVASLSWSTIQGPGRQALHFVLWNETMEPVQVVSRVLKEGGLAPFRCMQQ